MTHLRAVTRVVFLGGWTVAVYAIFLSTRLAHLRGAAAARRAQAWCFRQWARGAARVIGMQIETRGTQPSTPCFLVSNHLSYIDIVALGVTADWYFVAKSDVSRWPIIGFLARAASVIFVDRARRGDLPRVIGRMREALRLEHGVTFFPEGTSSDGSSVLPFKPSLFEAPIQTGYPVACASVWYATRTGAAPPGRAVCWWGDMTFLDHFYKLLGLEGFEARVTYSPEPVTASDRKTLAEAAHSAVAALFSPLPSET